MIRWIDLTMLEKKEMIHLLIIAKYNLNSSGLLEDRTIKLLDT